MVKKIAVYGSFEVKVHVRQRYEKWCYHRKGKLKGEKWYKARRWKKTKAMKKVEDAGRYEFHGKGKDLYRAIVKAHKFMPKGYVTVSAEKFLEHPDRYGFEGEWIEREVESP